MIKVCTGWLAPHPEVVMTPEDGTLPLGGVSHGMCEACKAESDQELQKIEAYDEYVRNFPLHDPRD